MSKKITINDLAAMVMKGFDEMNGKFNEVHENMDKGFGDLRSEMDQRFKQVDQRFVQIDQRFEEIDIELAYIKSDVKEVKNNIRWVKENMIPVSEFVDLSEKVSYVEEKLGIESGK